MIYVLDKRSAGQGFKGVFVLVIAKYTYWLSKVLDKRACELFYKNEEMVYRNHINWINEICIIIKNILL